jgi:pimeloyl-ACP methyl ester carboxylesterase
MDTDLRNVPVPGGQLAYTITGAGEPVVLIHGFSLDQRMWQPQIAALAADYQVVAYDLRGFGRSSRPAGAPYRHEADLAALLNHLEMPSAHLIGLSLGGAVALDFALTYPGRARSLLLADAVLRGFNWSEAQGKLDGAIWETAAREGLAAAQAAWLRHPLFAPAFENPQAAPLLRQIVSEYSGWHFVNADPIEHFQPQAAARLGELALPVLSVVGERDLPDFRVISRRLAAEIRGAREVVVPGAGHMVNLEAPAQFNALALQFLRSSASA